MQTFLRILSLVQALMCVEMKRETGNVFVGTEGDKLEITCKYPDGYQYTAMYFCRDPCGYSDTLIEAQKVDKVFTKGRYSILNTMSARSTSVTINNLRKSDSGVYYCGVEKWGHDKLTKINITVRKGLEISKEVQITSKPPTTPVSHLQTTTDRSSLSSDATGTHSTAGNTSRYDQPTSAPHSPVWHELPVYGGVLGLLLSGVVVSLVVLYRRQTNTLSPSLKPPATENQPSAPPPDQENLFHVYDEMSVYSLAGPAHTENSSETYCVIQYIPPPGEDSPLYSFVAPHN